MAGTSRMLKMLPWVAVAAVVLFLAYGWVNTMVSLDHSRQAQEYGRRRTEVLRDLIRALGPTFDREEVVRLVRTRMGEGHIVKVSEGVIQVDDVLMKFEGDKLKEVTFLDE